MSATPTTTQLEKPRFYKVMVLMLDSLQTPKLVSHLSTNSVDWFAKSGLSKDAARGLMKAIERCIDDFFEKEGSQ